MFRFLRVKGLLPSLLLILLACGDDDGSVDGGFDGSSVDGSADSTTLTDAVPDGETTGPCRDQACSDHGTCEVVGGRAECRCDTGFMAADLTCVAEPDPCDLFIATDGDDMADGTEAAPFATLERARSAIGVLRDGAGLPEGGVEVCLRGGVYPREDTFELGTEDSGSADSPIVYRSVRGEDARISGALRLPGADFSPVTTESAADVFARIDPLAHGNLVQIDLSAHTTDYGELVSRGTGRSRNDVSALELYVDGQRMELARWPDAGDEMPFVMTGPAGTLAFTYTGDRPERWADAEDPWLHGFWRSYWSEKHVQVTNINTGSKRITFAEPRGAYYGIDEGFPYYAENLLEEITVPGEWYLNRSSGVLYLWPLEPLSGDSEVMVSLSEQPLVSIEDASYVEFRDITFEMNRSTLLRIEGGDHCSAVSCRFLHGGVDAVLIDGGTSNGLSRCEISDIGNAGVVLSGGDRLGLVSTDNFVQDSHIHDVAYWSWTYTGAVRMERTIGVTIGHNHIHGMNHQAIGFAGNDNIIEFNDIHDVCRWSGDAGAVYSGRRWDYRGNEIRYNFIHDVSSGFDDPHGVHGIYLDDALAGVRIFGNIIHRIQYRAINARGGRDTIIQNNVLTDSGIAISVDMAGIQANPTILQNLVDMNYRDEPWASAYPEAAVIPNRWADIEDSHWLYPEESLCQRNIGSGNEQFFREGDYDGTGVLNKYADVSDNVEDAESLFVDAEGGDFRLRPDGAAFDIDGFEDIPFEEIGIRP